LDADDLWHPQKLAIQLGALHDQNDVALVGSPSAKTLHEVLPPAPPVYDLTVRDFLLSAPMGPSSALLRRQCLGSVGMFDESLQPAADRDMWLRIAAKWPCVLVESPCWWYRRHPGQMSRNAERMFCDYHRLLSKFFASNPKYRRLRGLAMSYLYFDAAVAHFDEGERIQALRHLARSVAYHPLGLGDPKWRRLARSKFAGRIVLDKLLQLAPK
jgi:hypothetical protein